MDWASTPDWHCDPGIGQEPTGLSSVLRPVRPRRTLAAPDRNLVLRLELRGRLVEVSEPSTMPRARDSFPASGKCPALCWLFAIIAMACSISSALSTRRLFMTTTTERRPEGLGWSAIGPVAPAANYDPSGAICGAEFHVKWTCTRRTRHTDHEHRAAFKSGGAGPAFAVGFV